MGALKPVALSLKGLTFAFPGAGAPVLEDIHLEMEAGGFLVLVGESGCGKSTLLRLLAGLEQPTEGSILFDGVEVNRLEPRERDVAMVFQSYALYPHMTVAENLGFPLRVAKQAPAEIKRRVGEVAEALGLRAFLQRKPGELSGGQRQRVAMGRAMVRRPRLFLFDEPLSNLDANLRSQMRAELGQRHRELGVTTVYVTHDQLEAMTLADKLVVMNGGRIEQVGKPLDIYSNPASVFVAGFMGSPGMNLLDTKALARVAGSLPDFVSSQCGTIGIRPEDITLTTPDQPHLKLDVVVDAVELVGSESLVYAHADGIDKELVLRTQGIHPGEHDDKLTLYVQHAQLHCFDAGTGRKIPR